MIGMRGTQGGHPMPGPLDGVRIIDLTTMISGPFATMILGDQGADVIKVESPDTGDLLRYFGTTRGGLAAFFTTSNRNKRSMVLNLKEPRGVELVHQLVAGADVFIQNFRPGAAERMGIGEAALREARPDLIYVSISGFGETGPYAHQRVYDPVIQALSGLASVQGDADSGKPAMVRTIVPDIGGRSAGHLLGAVCPRALWQRPTRGACHARQRDLVALAGRIDEPHLHWR
jgi:crotonobetainyl-CoA:carnitine CoA-transferase CaiB-like acyl-CoA transferase